MSKTHGDLGSWG